jgi:predicted permease
VGYTADEERMFCRRLKQKLTGRPGVEAVSYAIETPLQQGGDETVEVEGYTPRRGESMVIPRNNVGPDYFRVMRIPLLAGRDFTERDDRQSRPVAIVNEAFARRYFAGGDPVGRKMRIALGSWATIVGVVKNSKYAGPDEQPRPYYYAPFQQYFASGHSNNFFIRTSGNVQAAEELRRSVAELEPTGGIATVQPLQASVDAALYGRFIAARLMTALGILSLLLASVGLYSVLSYAVSERTQEIGVRMALGAEPVRVAQTVMAQVARITAPGLVAGAALGVVGAQMAEGMLAAVSPTDPLVLAVTALVLSAVALLAGLAPALRATRVTPLEALRSE